jgi:hypothetical protein
MQATVGDLKAELLLELDVPLPLQRLLLKGKPLADDKKLLREYGVVDGSNLTMQVKKEVKANAAGPLERAVSAPVLRAPAVGEPEPALGRSATGPASNAQAAAATNKTAEQDQAARAHIGETYSALAAAAAATPTGAAGGLPDYQFEGGGADVQTELGAAVEAMAAQLPSLDPLLVAAGAALTAEGGAQDPAREALLAPLRSTGKALAALGSAVQNGAVLPAQS